MLSKHLSCIQGIGLAAPCVASPSRQGYSVPECATPHRMHFRCLLPNRHSLLTSRLSSEGALVFKNEPPGYPPGGAQATTS